MTDDIHLESVGIQPFLHSAVEHTLSPWDACTHVRRAWKTTPTKKCTVYVQSFYQKYCVNLKLINDFPSIEFLKTFICYRGYSEVYKSSEIVFVAICVRSYYIMPVLLCVWVERVRCEYVEEDTHTMSCMPAGSLSAWMHLFQSETVEWTNSLGRGRCTISAM